jgi:flagellar motor switch protein FliN/FliY
MDGIANFDIRGCISRSVKEVFRTKVSMETALLPEEQPLGPRTHRVAGILNFAGSVTGIFNLQVSAVFGRSMASVILGMEPAEVDLGTDVRDLIAELTIGVGGSLNSALNEAGHACALSAPSIAHGSDFTIESLNMDRYERFVFHADEHILIAEVGLKAVESAQTDLDFRALSAMVPVSNNTREKLDALDYRGNVSKSLIDVFESTYALNLRAADTVSAASPSGRCDVSSVCLVGGVTATVSIYFGGELTRRLAANIRGGQPGEIEGREDIRDILGQLGRRVGSDLSSALAETGVRCALCAPFLITGSDFKIEALNLERYENFALQAEGHPVMVEMGVQISNPAEAPAEAAPSAAKDIRRPKAEAGIGPIRAVTTAEIRAAAADPSRPQASGIPDAAAAPEDLGLGILLDIPVELTVELGRTKMPIHELLRLQPGSTVKLARLEGEPVDILASDVLIARGEVVIRSEKYGIRITEITSRADRLKGLK